MGERLTRMADSNNGAFIWSIANLLRGTYKQAVYGKVILPFTILRRLDGVLEPTKQQVLDAFETLKNQAGLDYILPSISKRAFYNTSRYTLQKLSGDPANIRSNLLNYIEGFSANVRDIFQRYEFVAQLIKCDENDLPHLVLQKFAAIDLHPTRVSNTEMGMIFEELIRKFAETSNETAGEHFTPREVVRLMVSLLFTEHPGSDPSRSLTVPGAVLDFVNDPAVILESFEPYFKDARLTATSDPNLVHDLRDKLDVLGIYLSHEVNAAATASVLAEASGSSPAKRHGALSAAVAPARQRFNVR